MKFIATPKQDLIRLRWALAACAAVWLHGMAGDMAALQHTQAAMNARDIAVALPGAFKRVAVR